MKQKVTNKGILLLSNKEQQGVHSSPYVSWDMLPPELIAMAWEDPAFKAELLQYPTAMMEHFFPERVDPNVTYCIVENTDSLRCFVLPYRKPETFGWDREKVRSFFTEAIGNDHRLSVYLPVAVLVEAWFNPDFKEKLLINANNVLASMGYQDSEMQYMVLENSENTAHLVFPFNDLETENAPLSLLAKTAVKLYEYPVYH